jgi:ATP-dependent DNA ligase
LHVDPKLAASSTVCRAITQTSALPAYLRKRLGSLVPQPYTKRIGHKGFWVEPKLLAEIGYRAKSADGKVRHPFFRGLREDLCWMRSIVSGSGRTSFRKVR